MYHFVPSTYPVHTIIDGAFHRWTAAELKKVFAMLVIPEFDSKDLDPKSWSSSAYGLSCWWCLHKMLQPAGGCGRWRSGSEPLDSRGGRCLSGDYGGSSLQRQSKLQFWNGPWLVRLEDVWGWGKCWSFISIGQLRYILFHDEYIPSMVASAGETDQDLAATQFTKNCVAYNIIDFNHFKFKTI